MSSVENEGFPHQLGCCIHPAFPLLKDKYLSKYEATSFVSEGFSHVNFSAIIVVMKFSSVLAVSAFFTHAVSTAIGKSLVVERGSGDLQNIVSLFQEIT